MRRTPDYAVGDADWVKALVRENPWASLISFVPGRGLVASHYPIMLEEDTDAIVIVSHVGRPDERLHELGRHELLVVISGPQGYVSPGWYEVTPAVPTWNFAVAHAYGTPELLSDEDNLDVLERMVRHLERPLATPFLMTGTLENEEYARRIVGGTVGFRLRVDRFEAKEKMSQDKPPAVVDRVLAHLRSPGPYANPALADRMERVHHPRRGTENA
ncbi:FMN-binding negative transcriptional regulator [Microbacterium oleivorans]|uniref:FMN-binding negative transcriptional regulator n=1 Tax=Microbacterium oleivorans TaxID=273677 RepID=A0A7D5EZ25_9MICO|nr:FMN-binding negative transcriptional regulator [Microbacterium oleivorans]QLD13084.1 FMN-binding negative transcriptional regulator [Microbacterium oleivorans]